MFPATYFAPRYFAPHYWAKVGAAAAVIVWTSYGGLYEHLDSLFGGLTPTFEVCMKQTTGTIYARLYDTTGASASGGSQISTTSGSRVLVKSGGLTLVDGHLYEAQFGVVSGDGGAFYSARIIYAQP